MPPVLACFSDQDARVRYYACESMYNIAKVAKGEILLFFNEIFDDLSKVSSLIACSTILFSLPCFTLALHFFSVPGSVRPH